MRKRSGLILTYGLLLLGAVIMVLPLVLGVLGALQTPADLAAQRVRLAPQHWQWANFVRVWRSVPLARGLGLSVLVTAIETAGQLLTGILTAFGIILAPRWARYYLLAAVVVLMAIPGEALMIPNFVMLARLHQLNHLSGLVLPFLVSGVTIVLLTTAFNGVARATVAAARLDGASDWQLLWRVLVPSCAGIIGALALVNAIGNWNQFLWPLISTNSAAMRTAPVLVQSLTGEMGANFAAVLAASWWVTLPPIVAYIGLQWWLKHHEVKI